MFRGISAVNLDDKGRVAIPTRYRVQLTEESDGEVVVTIDTEERCLLLYPLAEWEHIEKRLEALPSLKPAARRIQRLLIGHATELTLDGNGRILLPTLLRDYAELSKNIILVGQGKKIEIWSEVNWQTGRAAWLEQGSRGDGAVPEELATIVL